jgi:hypothetical protein
LDGNINFVLEGNKMIIRKYSLDNLLVKAEALLLDSQALLSRIEVLVVQLKFVDEVEISVIQGNIDSQDELNKRKKEVERLVRDFTEALAKFEKGLDEVGDVNQFALLSELDHDDTTVRVSLDLFYSRRTLARLNKEKAVVFFDALKTEIAGMQ